jgi:long-chain fatty acid transport protein
MKKLLLISAATLIVSNSTFAGGILTNTNQHAAFLRMLSRGATTEIDGALSNPAGLAFLPKDGFHVGLSIQSAYQTRNIDASFMTYNGVSATGPTVADKPFEKYYEGTAAAPVIPSLFAAYKKGEWTNYEDYTKKSTNYNGTGLPGTNVYSRTNKVFGLSADYSF